MDKIRAFIAIDLPHELTEKLRQIEARLDAGYRGVSWVRPENIHITLKFLAQIDAGAVERINSALATAAAGIAPFTLTAQGIGGFPSLKSPRIIWAGIEEHAALTELHKKIEVGLGSMGFEKEPHRFNPHLTLCRVKSVNDSVTIGKAAEALKAEAGLRHKIEVTEFVLYKSVLTPGGSEYTALKKISLGR